MLRKTPSPYVALRKPPPPTDCAASRTLLPLEVAFVITCGPKREGYLVPILLFFVFVAVVCVCILALGYVLSLVEKRTASPRCRMPHETYHRRNVRRRRVRCRFEG
jgi:hypothetical protein